MAKEYKFPCAHSKFGAPMGRREENPARWFEGCGYGRYGGEKIRLFRVRLNSGGYDNGGAYWGSGTRTLPLYCAATKTSGVFMFQRAPNRETAKAQITARANGCALNWYR